MNYLQFLNEDDYKNMLEKCNLKLSLTAVEPIRFGKNNSKALIFCEKIKLDDADKLKQTLFNHFQNMFPNAKQSYLSFFENNIVIFLTNFEMFDSYNQLDYSDILFETISKKLASNEKLLKKYKKDFVKFYKKMEKEEKKEKNTITKTK